MHALFDNPGLVICVDIPNTIEYDHHSYNLPDDDVPNIAAVPYLDLNCGVTAT